MKFTIVISTTILSFSTLQVLVAGLPCGSNTPVSMFGAPSAAAVAQSWVHFYEAACHLQHTFSILTPDSTDHEGSDDAAMAVCGFGGGPVDVGLSSRQFKPYEAVRSTKNPYSYTCARGITTRKLTEIQIAMNGIAFVAVPNGVVANCISSLTGGGLSYSQIRWIYSSFSRAQLALDPLFDQTAIPNSDGNDSTHLWSELCLGTSCNCPAVEIGIAGLRAESDMFKFFAATFLTGSGETVRSSYQSDPQDDTGSAVINTLHSSNQPNTLGFVTLQAYSSTLKPVVAFSVKNPDDGVYRFPTYATSQDGMYPVAFYLYMYVADSSKTALGPFFQYYAFTYDATNQIASHGYLPLPKMNQLQMLARLGLLAGVDLKAISCGLSGTGSIVQGGSSVVYPLASLWGGIYSDACGINVKTISGSDTFSAQLACGVTDAATGQTADIGTLSRPFTTAEAILPSGGNGYDYKCQIGTKRVVREFPVANQAIAFVFPSFPSSAASCNATLPGQGLTRDQLRWMFSSFTTEQLVNSGWDPSSVTNSDGNDNTHLWSELGGSGCPKRQILIAGYSTETELYRFFASILFTGNDETVRAR